MTEKFVPRNFESWFKRGAEVALKNAFPDSDLQVESEFSFDVTNNWIGLKGYLSFTDIARLRCIPPSKIKSANITQGLKQVLSKIQAYTNVEWDILEGYASHCYTMSHIDITPVRDYMKFASSSDVWWYSIEKHSHILHKKGLEYLTALEAVEAARKMEGKLLQSFETLVIYFINELEETLKEYGNKELYGVLQSTITA